MKGPVFLTLTVLFAIILSACGEATSQPADEMINPGDNIGDFLITAGEEENVTFGFDLDCIKGEGENYACKASVGEQVIISIGLYDDTYSGKLDERWSKLTAYQILIVDRPVNLQAFKTIEVTHPLVGVIRYWNVVIIASKPAKITVYESGLDDGKPYESTTTYTFSEP